MSRLKDIMDIDVEPLQSQAYRRAQVAAQHGSGTFPHQPSPTPSSPTPSSSPANNQERLPTKRRRPNRPPKPDTHNMPSRSSSMQQQSSSVGGSMASSSEFRGGGGLSDPAGTLGAAGPESTLDVRVKYTPVTRRISKAKKGVPVHTCDGCDPPKTFTRAEHLRRHQLGHKKPAYSCTFTGCDRAFYRSDLLVRHMQRHETQGEMSYNSPVAESRPSPSGSDPLDRPTSSSKGATLPQAFERSSAGQATLLDSTAPRTSAGVDGSAMNFNTTGGSFQASMSGVDPSVFSAPSTAPSMPSTDCYPHIKQPTTLANFPDSHDLTLQIPEEPPVPSLSFAHENSPFCSSASDSNYSTQSDYSRPSRQWTRRGRSSSVHNGTDWSAAASQFRSGVATGPPQVSQDAQFGSLPEQFEARYVPPRIAMPNSSGPLFEISNAFEYNMEPMDTPVLSSFKPLSPDFPGASPRTPNASYGGIDFKTKQLMEPQLEALCITATMEHLAPLDPYIASYWESCNTFFPIIHRGTFNPTENDLLSSAMAALGTQYHNTAAARQKGVELNDYCRKSIDLFPVWDIHTMQAIFLTEVFTRYRGRKTNIKLSRQFDQLYSRLIDNSRQDQTALSSQGTRYLAPATAPLNHGSRHPTALQQPDSQNEWARWIDIETRQRLLAFCFIFDTQQSIYHEQSRSNASCTDITSLLFLPCPDHIWNATNALDWQVQHAGYASRPLHQVGRDLQSVPQGAIFTLTLITCSVASRLPPREDPKYPNKFSPDRIPLGVANLRDLSAKIPGAHIYLALHHTPLHDLLAVAGDTWIFGKKITPPSAFRAAQASLKAWSSSLNAATATLHACIVLSRLLSSPHSTSLVHPFSSSVPSSASDYWALYVCALICWAFGSRHPSPSSLVRRPPADPAVDYLSAMLSLTAEDLLTNKAHMRGETAAVIDAVRERLEIDALGGKCMMLVDAVHVLTQLKEPGRGKWFR